jgi:hypothetical protein
MGKRVQIFKHMDNSTDGVLFIVTKDHSLLSIFCKCDVYFEK